MQVDRNVERKNDTDENVESTTEKKGSVNTKNNEKRITESKGKKSGIFSKIKSSEIYQKIRGIKNIEIIVSLIIIAIALLIYSNVAFKGQDNKPSGGGINSDDKNSSMVSTEDKLAGILAKIDGAGAVSVMIYFEEKDNGKNEKATETITGVIIVAEGADNIGVRMGLTEATMTLLNISADKIEIFKASGGKPTK